MARSALARASVIGSLVSFPVAAAGQGRFSEADQSAVRYAYPGVHTHGPCTGLQSFTGTDVTILATEAVSASAGVPAYCEVRGVIAPEIEFRVRLPDGWNRRVYMTGNGGHAGEDLDQPYLVAQHHHALRRGFVTTATNTGHSAAKEPDATFAYNNNQKLIDYAFRAVHLTVVLAKQMAVAYYDRPVTFSYWDGCSTGGRQGLMEAQRYPEDFDGILAGAPVLDFTGTTIMGLWFDRVQEQTPISVAKMTAVATAVEDKCDAVDGLRDGLIDDPRNCDFDPARDVRSCPAGQSGIDCLTQAEAEALKKLYGGPTTSGGESIFPGLSVGSEHSGSAFGRETPTGWAGSVLSIGGRDAFDIAIAKSSMRYMVFPQDQPDWDASTFDFDKGREQLAALGSLVDAIDPDLADFRERGAKLLMYFGWSDPLLMPLMGVHYYQSALEANGPGTTDFFRLFMMPGVFHCGGGYGPDQFDGMTQLVEWVENGTAPDAIQATQMENGNVVRTRPLCPYPQVARYDGSGDVNDASNFSCQMPRR